MAEKLSRPMSFYEVIEVWSETGMQVRDVLTGKEHTVRERMGSRYLQPGDMVYTQVITAEGVSTLHAMAPLPIPPKMKSEVVDLRIWLRARAGRTGKISAAHLKKFADEVRSTYLDIRDCLLTPPTMCNTDGELYELHELKYQAGSAQVAFDGLSSLAVGTDREEWLANAKFDETGGLLGAELQWLKRGNRKHKHWDNTVLGHIRIEGRDLTVTVNSAERAARIKKEIESRLGLAAVLVEDKIVDSNSQLRRRVKSPKASVPLSQQPVSEEMLEIATEQMRKFEDSWVRQKIPALGGKTPYQAVKDPDGREILESLLLEMERSPTGNYIGGIRPDVARIRAKLKL